MTQMPELVALMHSLVGLAAVLVGYANYIDPAAAGQFAGAEKTIHEIEIYIGILIGAVTFSGSVIAFGKLSGKISGKPMLLPGRHLINLVGLLVVIWFGWSFINTHSVADGMTPLIVMTVIALLFGIHMVMAIGGADMPVVVSMLNSYSGWAAAATGFMLSNDLLIVTGALVGSSGAILSYIMCRAMNRHFIAVIAGGFGTEGGTPAAAGGVQPADSLVPVLAATEVGTETIEGMSARHYTFESAAMGLTGQPAVVRELIFAAERKAALVGIPVDVVGIDAVTVFLHGQVQAGLHQRVEQVQPANIEPFLVGPALEHTAQHFTRESIRVRPPVLPTAGAEIADHFAPLGMQLVDQLLRRIEQIDIVNLGVDRWIDRSAQLNLPARGRQRSPDVVGRRAHCDLSRYGRGHREDNCGIRHHAAPARNQDLSLIHI